MVKRSLDQLDNVVADIETSLIKEYTSTQTYSGAYDWGKYAGRRSSCSSSTSCT